MCVHIYTEWLKGILLRHVTDLFLIEFEQLTKRSSFQWNCAIEITTSAYLEAIWRNKLSYITQNNSLFTKCIVELINAFFFLQIYITFYTTRP